MPPATCGEMMLPRDRIDPRGRVLLTSGLASRRTKPLLTTFSFLGQRCLRACREHLRSRRPVANRGSDRAGSGWSISSAPRCSRRAMPVSHGGAGVMCCMTTPSQKRNGRHSLKTYAASASIQPRTVEKGENILLSPLPSTLHHKKELWTQYKKPRTASQATPPKAPMLSKKPYP